jgi:preprotein translocase subunit SecD
MYIMGALDYQATLDDVKGGPPTLCQSAAADWTTAIDAIIQNLAEVYRTKPMLNQTDAALGVHYIATELYACRRRSRVEFRPGDWDERGGLEKVHSPGIRQPIFVGSDALLTNNDIVAVSVRTETDGSYVDVELSKDGGRIFRAWSSMNVGRPMVIFVDGTIVAAPISVGRIENNRFTISGNNTPEFAKALADALMK